MKVKEVILYIKVRNISKKYYYTTSTITIVNTKKELMDLTRELLESLDFHPSAHKRNSVPPYKPLYAVLLSRKIEVNRFFNIVKPCIKTGEKR